MANWCSTIVTIKACEESIERLAEEFRTAMSSNPADAGFGNEWLGNLLLRIGFTKEEACHGDIRCRGSIEDITASDNEITLETESAWAPHLQCIALFVEHYAQDATIEYEAVETMNDLVWTNKEELVGMYYVDMDNESGLLSPLEEIAWQPVREEVLQEVLEKITGKKGTVYELERELWEMLTDNDFLSIHQYEYVPLEECD